MRPEGGGWNLQYCSCYSWLLLWKAVRGNLESVFTGSSHHRKACSFWFCSIASLFHSQRKTQTPPSSALSFLFILAHLPHLLCCSCKLSFLIDCGAQMLGMRLRSYTDYDWSSFLLRRPEKTIYVQDYLYVLHKSFPISQVRQCTESRHSDLTASRSEGHICWIWKSIIISELVTASPGTLCMGSWLLA